MLRNCVSHEVVFSISDIKCRQFTKESSAKHQNGKTSTMISFYQGLFALSFMWETCLQDFASCFTPVLTSVFWFL